jgi:hypothetical protein
MVRLSTVITNITDYFCRLKVFIMQSNAFKTFDLVINIVSSYFGTRSKVFN